MWVFVNLFLVVQMLMKADSQCCPVWCIEFPAFHWTRICWKTSCTSWCFVSLFNVISMILSVSTRLNDPSDIMYRRLKMFKLWQYFWWYFVGWFWFFWFRHGWGYNWGLEEFFRVILNIFVIQPILSIYPASKEWHFNGSLTLLFLSQYWFTTLTMIFFVTFL